jgi:outer membrane protein assembly factor BamE (lipoprotein component of BamABCDE complex)
MKREASVGRLLFASKTNLHRLFQFRFSMKTSKSLLLVAALLAALAFAGCTTPESRIRRNPEAFARLSPPQQELIRQGQISLGFDREMVRLALGEPDRVTIHTDARGTNEIWRYVEYEMREDLWMYDTTWAYSWHRWAYPYYGGYYRGRPHDVMRVTFRDDKVVSFEQTKD